jgi:hypothetical protein
MERRVPPSPAGPPAVRAQSSRPRRGLGELAAQLDGPHDRLTYRADDPLGSAPSPHPAAVDLVGELDASPACSLRHSSTSASRAANAASRLWYAPSRRGPSDPAAECASRCNRNVVRATQ